MNIKKIIGLLTFVFQITTIVAQHPELKKIKATNLDEVAVGNNHEKSTINKCFQNGELNLTKGLPTRAMKPHKEQNLIFSTQYENYYNMYDFENQRNVVSKYNYINEKSAEVILPVEGEVFFTNIGELIYLETGDGEAFHYKFYNNKLEEIGQYLPYSNGFAEYRHCLQSNKLVIFSKKSFDSRNIKIAVFSDFALVKEKEVSINFENILLDVKLSGENIILLVLNSDNHEQEIICFDDELNIIWEKNLQLRIVQNKILTTNNNLILISPENICKINCKTGHESWSKEFIVSENSILNSQIVLDGGYLAIIHGKLENNVQKNNTLYVIDLKSGDEVSTDKLENNTSDIFILSDEKSFTVLNNGDLLIYQLENITK